MTLALAGLLAAQPNAAQASSTEPLVQTSSPEVRARVEQFQGRLAVCRAFRAGQTAALDRAAADPNLGPDEIITQLCAAYFQGRIDEAILAEERAVEALITRYVRDARERTRIRNSRAKQPAPPVRDVLLAKRLHVCRAEFGGDMEAVPRAAQEPALGPLGVLGDICMAYTQGRVDEVAEALERVVSEAEDERRRTR